MDERMTIENIDKAKAVINRPLAKELIKQRDGGGGKKLDYIEGSTVIRLLNEAFDMKWEFEIVSKEIVEAIPKAMFTGWGKQKKPVLDAEGNQKYEEQSPFVEILGRLTVPGLSFREQYGTKILMGGSSEQEGASKSAATDALKKCATLFGVGLELYSDDIPTQPEKPAPTQPQVKQQTYSTYTQKKAEPAPVQNTNAWNEVTTKQHADNLKRLGELKSLLGITENKMLDVYAIEFFNKPDAGFEMILPDNIEKFNQFLIGKTPA